MVKNIYFDNLPPIKVPAINGQDLQIPSRPLSRGYTVLLSFRWGSGGTREKLDGLRKAAGKDKGKKQKEAAAKEKGKKKKEGARKAKEGATSPFFFVMNEELSKMFL